MKHVAIAGAGLTGRLLAWRLAREGWRVSLFDSALRGQRQSASHVAAAMLSPLAELPGAEASVPVLARRSLSLWPQWLTELEAEGGRSVYFRREGSLVLAHAADRANLRHFLDLLEQRLPAAERGQVQPLDAEALGQLEPALAGRFEEGVWLHGEAQLANDELLQALQSRLEQDTRVHWQHGTRVRSLRGSSLQTDVMNMVADVVVDARGVGARPDWPGLRGVRGEVLTVECPGVQLRRPVRLLHPRYQIYIAPRPAHRFVVGATELESEDPGAPTLRSTLELGSALYSLHPGFGEARLLHVEAALRPALDDHRPCVREQAGVWQINGLYRHGYLCGPALVEQLVKELS